MGRSWLAHEHVQLRLEFQHVRLGPDPGGLNIVLCDGSVRNLRYTVDVMNVLLPLCVRDDGMTFNADGL